MSTNPPNNPNMLVDPSGQPLVAQPETDMSELTDAEDARERRQASIERQLNRRAGTFEPEAELDEPDVDPKAERIAAEARDRIAAEAAEALRVLTEQAQDDALEERQATLDHYDIETHDVEEEEEFYEEDELVEDVQAAYETAEQHGHTAAPAGFSIFGILIRGIRFNVELGTFWLRLVRSLIRPQKIPNDDA